MRFAVFAAGLVACATPPELPTHFALSGEASASEGGTDVDCALDLLFDVEAAERDGRSNVTTGVHGGEVARRILDPEGAGFLFHADVFGEVEVSVDAREALLIRIPINDTAEGRFWTSMARFEGTWDGVDGEGTWTCAPLDIDQEGYVDETVVAEGTWTME